MYIVITERSPISKHKHSQRRDASEHIYWQKNHFRVALSRQARLNPFFNIWVAGYVYHIYTYIYFYSFIYTFQLAWQIEPIRMSRRYSLERVQLQIYTHTYFTQESRDTLSPSSPKLLADGPWAYRNCIYTSKAEHQTCHANSRGLLARLYVCWTRQTTCRLLFAFNLWFYWICAKGNKLN